VFLKIPIPTTGKEVSLYFHIPFCTKKCPYCHFYVVPNKPLFQNILSEALQLEWEQKLPLLKGKTIVSVYFGGGTPTLFAISEIEKILDRIKKKLEISPASEITIEANPEEANSVLFENLRKIGINRLSIGVQSLDDRELNILGRTHSAKMAKKAIYEASSFFQNISIDLMYDLPDQTEASWDYTLDEVAKLPITHLSLYNLTFEPHTSFYKRRHLLHPPDQTISLRLLQKAVHRLESLGLKRYEISAFAKESYFSHHNTGYWTARPFLGFGPSAFSFWEGERFRNIANLQRYARSLKEGSSSVDFREKLSYPANVKELLAVNLRLLGGVDLRPFSPLPEETQIAIKKWIEEGFLEQKANHLRLTEKGVLFYDAIAEDVI